MLMAWFRICSSRLVGFNPNHNNFDAVAVSQVDGYGPRGVELVAWDAQGVGVSLWDGGLAVAVWPARGCDRAVVSDGI